MARRQLFQRRSLGAPVPPLDLPDGRTVTVPGRGEFFLRDTGGQGQPVLLVHGWMFPSDLNWARQYQPLADAGFRVLAVDCRGHGRGLRTTETFRLTDCADDLAAILIALQTGPALVAGYSMGGPISQLLTHRHPEQVAGLVQCATSQSWDGWREKAVWRTMAGLRAAVGSFPRTVWKAALKGSEIPPEARAWVVGELSRGSAADLAEAGRELGRFNSAAWVGSIGVPAQVILTSKDRLVPRRNQQALAEALGVLPVVVPGDHDTPAREDGLFTEALLLALGRLRSQVAAAA